MASEQDELKELAELEELEELEKLEALERGGAAPAPELSGNEPQAALESYGNAALLGYLPQLQAAAERALPDPNYDINEKLKKQGFKIQEPSYLSARDENIARQARLAQENPVSSGLGTAGGIGAGMLWAKGLLPLKAAPSLWGAMKQGARAGGIVGAAANPGDEPGQRNVLQVPERMGQAARGAVVGGAIPPAISGIGAGLTSVGGGLKRAADWLSYKALGGRLRDFRKAHERGNLEAIGRQALDENVVTAFSSPAAIAEKAAARAKEHGRDLEDVLVELSGAERRLNAGAPGIVPHGTRAAGVEAGVQRKAIADSLRAELINPHSDLSGIAAKNAKVAGLIDEFEHGGNKLIGVLETEMKKRAMGKEINWNRIPGTDIPVEEQVQRALYTRLKQGVEDAGEYLEKAVHGPSSKRFTNIKNAYGNAESASRMAEDRVLRDAAAQRFGLTDKIMGSAGATAGAVTHGAEGVIPGMILAGAANKLGRAYGVPMSAATTNRLSQAALGAGRLARGARGPVIPEAAIWRLMLENQSRPEDEEY